jgi:hypothetical protein
VGAFGLAGAGVFSLMKSSAESDLDSTCRGSVCPESMRATKSASDRDRLLATVSLGVGVAGIGTAAVLWLTAGSDAPTRGKETSARLRFDVATSPGGIGFGARGAFLRATSGPDQAFIPWRNATIRRVTAAGSSK